MELICRVFLFSKIRVLLFSHIHECRVLNYKNFMRFCMEPTIKIGRAAKIIGCHPQTLLNYEKKGIISPVRDIYGHRRCKVFFQLHGHRAKTKMKAITVNLLTVLALFLARHQRESGKHNLKRGENSKW